MDKIFKRALLTIGQNYLREACSLTKNALQSAALNGLLEGLGFGIARLGSALDAVAANSAWNSASLLDKLSAISNAFVMTPSSEASLLVGLGNAIGMIVENSGPLLQ